jgi:hypothetical protein
VEYCYLEGQQGVYIETKQGFEVDGVEIKARMDFGAAAIDYRGMQKRRRASVEEIDVNPTDLPVLPARGDIVEAWGAVFTVTTVRQPDPYGMIHLTLTMQPPSQ